MAVLHVRDLKSHLCPRGVGIREAMCRLNEAGKHDGGRGYHFLVVVDENGRLVGTLSDGDFRRGIIAGASIDDMVERFACLSPVYGTSADPSGNIAKLKQNKGNSTYLPVVDGDGIVRDILLLTQRGHGECSVLIMAGGFGKRLGERTRNTPKPLLQVRDRPILAHILDRVQVVEPNDIYLSVHYLAEQIGEFSKTRPEVDRIRLLHEDSPLGTAGAIGLLPKTLQNPLIVSNGDVLTSLNFDHFWRFYCEHEYDAIVAVAQHTVKIPFGVVRHSESGEFLSISEKPTLSHYVNAGIYVLSPLFVSLVSPNEVIDMPELLARGQEMGLRVGLFPLHEYWTDIGHPDDFDRANQGEFGELE